MLGRRAFAYLIDGALSWFLALVVVAVLSPRAVGSARGGDPYAGILLGAGISFAYFFFSWTTYGTSPGQRMLGLRTVTYGDAALLPPRDAAARWAFLYGPSALLVPLLGLAGAGSSPAANVGSFAYLLFLYWSASRDGERRALHDRLSGSIVLGPGLSGSPAVASATELGHPPPRTAARIDRFWAGAVLLGIGVLLLVPRLIAAWQAAH